VQPKAQARSIPSRLSPCQHTTQNIMVHVSSAAASKAGHGSHGPGKSEFSLKLSWQPRSLGLGATYIPLSRLMQQLARLAPCVRPSFARQVHTHPTCKKIDIIQAAHQCQLIHAAERIYRTQHLHTHQLTVGGGPASLVCPRHSSAVSGPAGSRSGVMPSSVSPYGVYLRLVSCIFFLLRRK